MQCRGRFHSAIVKFTAVCPACQAETHGEFSYIVSKPGSVLASTALPAE